MSRTSFKVISRLPLLILGLWLLAESPVWAGPGQSGRKGGGTQQPGRPEQQVNAELDGTVKGYIQRFTPSKDEADENLIGHITFKPLDGRTKSFKMAVRRHDDLKIGIGEHTFAPEEVGEVLYKGLFCTATWQPNSDPKAKSIKRELKDLVMDTIDIEGKIDELTEEMVVIKGRPKEGDWPVIPGTGSRSSGTAPRMAVIRKLKLKIIEQVTKYSDPGDNQLEASEFEAGQSIDATIVYGKNQGIIVSLRTPGPRTATAITPEPNRGGQPPPRERGGRKPMGGG